MTVEEIRTLVDRVVEGEEIDDVVQELFGIRQKLHQKAGMRAAHRSAMHRLAGNKAKAQKHASKAYGHQQKADVSYHRRQSKRVF